MTKIERLRREKEAHLARVRNLEREIEKEKNSRLNKPMTVMITPVLYDKIETMATVNGQKKSEIVRQALAAYL